MQLFYPGREQQEPMKIIFQNAFTHFPTAIQTQKQQQPIWPDFSIFRKKQKNGTKPNSAFPPYLNDHPGCPFF